MPTKEQKERLQTGDIVLIIDVVAYLTKTREKILEQFVLEEKELLTGMFEEV